MKRVVTVNLGGKAYQLEEDGYALLAQYLETAAARLHGNPDAAEILLDLELAIADKAELALSARKNVVTTREIERIVEEMGPVDAFDDYGKSGEEPWHRTGGSERVDAAGAASQTQKPKRRLYRLTGKDKMLAGVCAGLAARSGIDVSLVRIAFVALTLATSGLGVVGYVALALLMPAADTPIEAAASGGVPFDVREVFDAAHAKLHALRAARRRSSREAHRHAGHRGAYAYASHHGRERHNGVGALLRFGMLVAALVFALYVFRQWQHFLHDGVWWFSPAQYAAGGASPGWLFLAVVLVAVALVWRFASARRERTSSGSGRSFAAFSVKLLVALVLAWFALQMVAGDVYFIHRPYYFAGNWHG